MAFGRLRPRRPECLVEIDRKARILVNACDEDGPTRSTARACATTRPPSRTGRLYVDINELSTTITRPVSGSPGWTGRSAAEARRQAPCLAEQQERADAEAERGRDRRKPDRHDPVAEHAAEAERAGRGHQGVGRARARPRSSTQEPDARSVGRSPGRRPRTRGPAWGLGPDAVQDPDAEGRPAPIGHERVAGRPATWRWRWLCSTTTSGWCRARARPCRAGAVLVHRVVVVVGVRVLDDDPPPPRRRPTSRGWPRASSIHRLRSGGAPRVRTAVHTIQIPSPIRLTPTSRPIATSTGSGTCSAKRIATTPRTRTMQAWPSA